MCDMFLVFLSVFLSEQCFLLLFQTFCLLCLYVSASGHELYLSIFQNISLYLLELLLYYECA
jgi:hypothetical protein